MFVYAMFGAGPRTAGARTAALATGRIGFGGRVIDVTGRRSMPENRHAVRPSTPSRAPHECRLVRGGPSALSQLPLLLKGPTGCGKTRFVAHMAARLGLPLYTVACHDDLTAADLTGRYLLKGGETVWVDGPLTRAVRDGGICYLDEVVEARKDVTVVLHPLTDDRRILPLERTGETLHRAGRASCSSSPTTPATRTS